MKRNFTRMLVIVMILMLSVTLMIGTTSATSAQELTDLAQFAPEDTPLFAAVRTDDGFIDSLDSLLELLGETGAEMGDAEDGGIRALLDMALSEMGAFEGGFDENVRSWLGDTAVAFMPSFDLMMGELDAYIVFDVTDEASAIAFVETLLANDLEDEFYEMVEEEGVVAFTPTTFSGMGYAIAYDALVISMSGSFDSLIAPDADMLDLSNNSQFNAFVDSLPADEYNAVVYTDLGVIAEQTVGIVAMLATMQTDVDVPEIDFDALVDTLDMQLGMGFTLLNDRSLVIDSVMFPSEELNEAMSLFMASTEAVDLDILNYVPADAPLVAIGSGFGDSINGLFTALEQLDQFLADFDVSLADMDTEGVPEGLANRSLSDIGTFIRLAFEGTTGLSLEETLAGMNGTYAFYAGVDAVEAMDSVVPVVDMGMVMFTDDADSSASYVEAVADFTTSMLTRATFEDGVLTVPADVLGISVPDMPSADMILTSNDELLVAGSSDTVSALLDGDSETLLDNTVYTYESELFLADSSMVWYFNSAPLLDVLETFYAEMGMDDMDMQLEGIGDIEALFSLGESIDSGSISISTSDDVVVTRLSLTLSAE